MNNPNLSQTQLNANLERIVFLIFRRIIFILETTLEGIQMLIPFDF